MCVSGSTLNIFLQNQIKQTEQKCKKFTFHTKHRTQLERLEQCIYEIEQNFAFTDKQIEIYTIFMRIFGREEWGKRKKRK